MANLSINIFTRAPAQLHSRDVNYRGMEKTVEIFDFLPPFSHYTTSFGVQWEKYRNVQIDRFNGTNNSLNHLKMFALGDLDQLRGKVILEIGSGAGRFTDYLVDLGARVISVDPSAIFHNVALGAENLVPVRADLFDIPVRREIVDVVFCRGVTQHTADVRKAIARLFDYVRPGGVVMFDVYHLKWFTPFVTKYWIRPFTRHIPADKFIPFAERWVPRLLALKNNVVKPFLPRNKFGINMANQIVPVADFSDSAELDPDSRLRWSVLDTVDMYTPRYDSPLTWDAVMKLMRTVRAAQVKGDRESFCFRATAPL